jgi:hypothetical protein
LPQRKIRAAALARVGSSRIGRNTYKGESA